MASEETVWEEAAIENEIVLYSVDVTDKEEFNELCGILRVSGVAAKSRLRRYIQQHPLRTIIQPRIQATFDSSPPPKQQNDISDLLENAKGGPLTESEIEYALMHYGRFIDNIMSKNDSRERLRLARRLWIRLSVRIKTQTRLAVSDQYLFDGPVPGAFGNLGTEVQFAVRGSSLYCAKIMRADSGTLQRERAAANWVHENQTCPTVMPVLDLVYLPGEPQRVAIITPYYPLSLSPLAGGNLQEEGCLNVALCGIGTIKAFQSKRLCHGDIKPGNMMLTATNDNLVVTIDFGSAVKYGESLRSVTPTFGMDCPQEGSLVYDLTCLASSIYLLCTGKTLPDTTKTLLGMLDDGFQHAVRPSLQIAKTCLESKDIDFIWNQAQTVVDSAQHIDRTLLVSVDKVWPAAHLA